MSKDQKNRYEPIDKLATVPWKFLRLVCMGHDAEKPELVLENTHKGPYYRCSKEDCAVSIPAVLYEKLLDNAVKVLNEKGAVLGYTWNRQAMRHIYSFTILEYDHEAGLTIGVKRLT